LHDISGKRSTTLIDWNKTPSKKKIPKKANSNCTKQIWTE